MGFREMRRNDKQLTNEESFEILKNSTHMILSTKLENGYPYSIPLNHAYEDGKVYFHCAMEGQKVDAFKLDKKVCISIVKKEEILPEKFTTVFTSVTAFGKISPVTDEEERTRGLTALIKKFSPDFYDSGIKYIEKLRNKTLLYAVEIEHITGKSNVKQHS